MAIGLRLNFPENTLDDYDAVCKALNFPIDVPAFREKMLRYRPKTIAFTSKKAASLFYGRPTKVVALGRQLPQDDFPTVFVLASPSGAATRYWSVQLWRELADSIPRSS